MKDENGMDILEKTIFAFDFMSLSFPSLLWAPLYVPALAAAFPPKEADAMEEDDEEGEALASISAMNCVCEPAVLTEKKTRKSAALPTSKKQKISHSSEKRK